MELAEDLMEEILSKPFYDPNGAACNPGPDAGETYSNRATLDNVDDYDGYTEAVGHIVPNKQTLASDPLAAQLGRSVQVQYVRLTGQSVSQAMNVCQVTVHVTYQAGDIAKVTRLVYANVTN